MCVCVVGGGVLTGWRGDKRLARCWNALSHTRVLASTSSSHSAPLRAALPGGPVPRVTQVRALATQPRRVLPFPCGGFTAVCARTRECCPFLQVLGQRALLGTCPQSLLHWRCSGRTIPTHRMIQ